MNYRARDRYRESSLGPQTPRRSQRAGVQVLHRALRARVIRLRSSAEKTVRGGPRPPSPVG